jgi:hypothetical protein
VWENTTVAGALWDLRSTRTSFAQREINAWRRGKHQLRVLLGDPPIDWEDVR